MTSQEHAAHAAQSLTGANPWMGAFWITTFITGLIGVALTGGNADPTQFDYSPLGAVIGQSLLIIAGMHLAGSIIAGAICWQLKRR